MALLLLLSIIFGAIIFGFAAPVEEIETTTTLNDENLMRNGSVKEVYVIKASTYEINVLANVPNNDTSTVNGTIIEEKVDVSFFNAKGNDSFLNLGDVPLPVQKNVSGEIIEGIAPVHIGAVHNVGDVIKSLSFSGAIVNITNSDNSFIQVDRQDIEAEEQRVKLPDDTDLAELPILDRILPPKVVAVSDHGSP